VLPRLPHALAARRAVPDREEGDTEAGQPPIQAPDAGKATSHPAIPGQNGLMRVIATRIEPDAVMHHRVADTARHSDRRQWEDLAGPLLDLVTAVMALGSECLGMKSHQPS